MIQRFNEWARGPLAIAACRAATPFSIVAHSAVYAGWWLSGVGELALAIAMSLEAIVLALIIIDKQNVDSAQEHAWQKGVYAELLEKLPDARPEVADADEV